MFKNYFVTALRNLKRFKLFSMINIGGLAVAFTASILIALFIVFETSYENWIPNAENIYRMDLAYFDDDNFGKMESQQGVSMGPLKAALEKDFSEIEQVTRWAWFGSTIKKGDDVFSEYYLGVDHNFFDVFKFSFIHGEIEHALEDPASVVLSERMAEKYFGDEYPLGKTLETASGTVFKVTGVFEDFPQNTEAFAGVDMFSAIDVEKYKSFAFLNDWRYNSITTYFTLKDGVAIETVQARLKDFLDQNMPWAANDKKPSDKQALVPLPLLDTRLHGVTNGDSLPGGGIKAVRFFGVIAALILAIAGFNYLNSSTAVASLRAREISMRKVVGAGQSQLVRQFLGESVLIALLAFLVSLVIVQLSVSWLDAFLGKPISSNLWEGTTLAMYALVLVPLIGLGAGLYPAFFLSRYKPSQIFMDKQINKPGALTFRALLVMLQFSASIGLIIVTLVIETQYTYSISGDLGFDRENKIILRGLNSSSAQDKMETLQDRYGSLPGIKGVAPSFSFPISGVNDTSPVTRPGQVEDSIQFISHAVGFDFFETYGIEILAGRTFSADRATDEIISPAEGGVEQITPGSAVINETALNDLGFGTSNKALGQTIRLDLDDGTGLLDLNIVGVISDFKELGVRQKILPSVYFNRPANFMFMTLSLEQGYAPSLLDQIDEIWNSTVSGQLVSRWFLDEFLREGFLAMETQASLLSIFSGLAIIISCLGLYGLASFAALRRTKEIGVRKIFGATVPRIALMMIKQFLTPIILANLVAWPIAWFYVDEWLTEFAYHINLNPLFFVVSGLVSLIVAGFAVGGSTFKIARAKPIHALRHE
jgi:putative ABC transport system permease protein